MINQRETEAMIQLYNCSRLVPDVNWYIRICKQSGDVWLSITHFCEVGHNTHKLHKIHLLSDFFLSREFVCIIYD